jgi:hypothetical protein
MARPDDLIASQRETIADMERKLELERAKLEGYIEMARAMGSPAKRESATSGKVGGRQPGSITKTWRRVLGALMLREGDWFSAHDAALVVERLEHREIRPSEVRRIFKNYLEYGYVEQNEIGQFRITDEAVAKFGLGNEPQQETTTADENEDEGEAPDASDEGGPDAGTSEPLDLDPYRLRAVEGG